MDANRLETFGAAAGVIALVVAASLSPFHDGTWVLLLVFGVVNAIAPVRGTGWVRTAAVAATIVALLSPETTRIVTGVAIWLVWPPAFFAAWAIDREARDLADGPASDRRARLTTAGIIAAVAVASVAFRLIAGQGLQQTAALFVGLPALLAIVVVLFTQPRTAVGVACKAVTVGLLVSLVFLGEGLLCILMSAPLFFAVAIFAAMVIHRLRRRREHRAPTTLYTVALFALVPMSLEGVHDRVSFPRDEVVAVTRIVQAPADEVRRALFEVPRFDRALPPYLAAGFPHPTAAEIDASRARPRWIVHLRGGETRLNGQEPAPGRLVLDLVDERPGRLTWHAAADDSHMRHFLDWREATVSWQPIDARTTRVTWTLRYRRGLDPAWYFGPWQRYAVRLAAGYLIDTVATP
jgi:hypothetical protein